jgi:D-alanyl-D-alanine carboxypeptidase
VPPADISGVVNDGEEAVQAAVSADYEPEEEYDTVVPPPENLHTGTLVLANETHTVQPPAVTDFGNKNDSYRLRDMQLKMHPEAIENMNLMFESFAQKSGHKNVMLAKAYDEENTDYGTGYAAELRILGEDGSNTEFTGEGKYSMLLEECPKFGFKYEDGGKMRYVSLPHSQIMYDYDYTLEEYLEYLKDFSFESPYIYNSDKEYTIYFSPAGQEVKIPKDCEHTISGNNMDGFIVTCVREFAEITDEVPGVPELPEFSNISGTDETAETEETAETINNSILEQTAPETSAQSGNFNP